MLLGTTYSYLVACTYMHVMHAVYGTNTNQPQRTSISLSFQPSGYYLLKNWIEDSGKQYQLQTDKNMTHTYGWSKDLTNKTWHIDVEDISFDKKFIETGIILDDCDIISKNEQLCDEWKIDLVPGYYSVSIGVGKPDYGTDVEINCDLYAQDIPLIHAVSDRKQISNVNGSWLTIASRTVQVLADGLKITQNEESFGCSILYLNIETVGCTSQSLHDILAGHESYISLEQANIQSFYSYPVTINIQCMEGYYGEFGILTCDTNGKWKWIGDEISCKKVECGDIPENLLSPYHANIYWQVYSNYNSKVLVTCNSKQVNYITQLVCTSTGKWQWINGSMPFRCPAWIPRKNKELSLFATHLPWFIALFIFVGIVAMFAILNVYTWAYRKYVIQVQLSRQQNYRLQNQAMRLFND